MEELQIMVSSTKGAITTNFEDIKKSLVAVLDDYKGIIVTEDTVKKSKKDVAELRKIRSSIDDEKKRVKKLWNEPYVEFENKCKELMALVDEPIKEINSQVEEFEQKEIEEKKNHFFELYQGNIDDLADYLPFVNVLPEKWMNKAFTDKDFLYSLSEKKIQVRNDLNAINSLNSEIENDVLDAYRKSGNNLSVAISRNSQYLSDKNKVTEQIKANEKNGTVSIEKPSPIQQFNDLAKKIGMVTFTVAAEDADQVENLLIEYGIIYRKE